MTTLEPLGASVPKLLAGGGEWLIQQDVGRFRLTQKLQGASEFEGIALLDAAVAALWQCQDAGAKAALGAGLKNLGGYGPLLETPAKLGKILKAPAPKLAAERILPLICAPERVFIKWDARPANAIVAENGAIFWIDWEEWGLRCLILLTIWFGSSAMNGCHFGRRRKTHLSIERFVPVLRPSHRNHAARKLMSRRSALFTCCYASMLSSRRKARRDGGTKKIATPMSFSASRAIAPCGSCPAPRIGHQKFLSSSRWRVGSGRFPNGFRPDAALAR